MDFLLDENGDLLFDYTGDIALDEEAIRQDIKEIISLNKGNDYHAPHIGVGVFSMLNNTKKSNITSLKQTIRVNLQADGITATNLNVNQTTLTGVEIFATGQR